MGNSSYTLAIQTEEANYSAGDLVNGRVYLSVSEPSIDCEALIIHFHGQELAKVHYTSHHHDSTDRGDNSCDHYETHKETILDENYTVHSFASSNNQIPRGQYEFPFQMQIPNDLPSSMHCTSGKSRCEVRYNLTAVMQKPSLGRGVRNPFRGSLSSKPIILYINRNPNNTHCILPGRNGNGTGNSIGNKTLHFISETQRINYWCCINRGFMEVHAQLAKNLTGEENSRSDANIPVDAYTGVATLTPEVQYMVPLIVSNQSTTSVNSVRLELIENVKWKPKYREASSSNSIIRKSINDCTVASWKGRESMFHFAIPWSARDTYQGRLIEVKHILRIKAITECCMTNPSTEMCITITRPFLESDLSIPHRVEGGPMLSPLDETEAPSESPLDDDEPMIVEAITLPDDWTPHTADMVSLPVATVVGVSNESNEGAAHAAVAWAEGVTYPVLPTAPQKDPGNFD